MNEEHEPHTCGWLVKTSNHPGECYPDDEVGYCTRCEEWAENGGWGIVECGAPVTELPNGWECAAGHSHLNDVEYYDDEEIAGLARRGLPLAPNAARMDGTRI